MSIDIRTDQIRDLSLFSSCEQRMRTARGLACVATLAIISIVVGVVMSASAKILTGFGGDGGGPNDLDCGSNSVLVGLDARYGDFMDSVEIVCRKVDASGRLGPEYLSGRAGGNGGQPHRKTCPTSSVVGGISGGYGRYINSITLICRSWDGRSKAPTSNEVARIDFTGAQAAPKRQQDVSCE